MQMRMQMLASALVVLLSAPAPVAAQIDLRLAGGASIPVGDFADAVELGWHGLGVLELTTPMQPMSLRVDGQYNMFALSADEDESVSVISGTLNLGYRLPTPGTPFSPYVIAGLGAYHSDCTSAGCEGTTKFGWNGGLGTKLYFLGFRSFLEARFHSTSSGNNEVRYVPVTLGVIF